MKDLTFFIHYSCQATLITLLHLSYLVWMEQRYDDILSVATATAEVTHNKDCSTEFDGVNHG